jgi:hypothetical protein
VGKNDYKGKALKAIQNLPERLQRVKQKGAQHPKLLTKWEQKI